MLQLGDVGIAIDGMHTASGMPGGTGGQFRPLDQLHVFPTGFGQVIKHTGADHTAANDGHSHMGFHFSSSSRHRRCAALADAPLHKSIDFIDPSHITRRRYKFI